ncbi:hypothetical protein R3Q06_30090 [Rhodococcus erythropolis]|nr:hypothetical protein [Rhodococcus erythropolis]MDV6277749.1 hypothetical protein [Rhodococcus erythropolis]
MIAEIDEAGAKATIESVKDAAGKCPFPTALANLADADSVND